MVTGESRFAINQHKEEDEEEEDEEEDDDDDDGNDDDEGVAVLHCSSHFCPVSFSRSLVL